MGASNYDELRYSMRAALQSWGKHVRRFHLIAAYERSVRVHIAR